MILRIKALWLVLVAAILVLILAGCNDTLRQFITPVPSPTGDPSALSHAIVVSRNLPVSSVPQPGSNLHIDVSGDSVVGVVPVGIDPNFLGKSSNRIYDLNSDNTVTSYIALNPLSGNPSVTTLPAGALGVAGAASPANNFYMANPGQNNLNVIAPAPIAVTSTLPVVGTNPVAVAASATSGKIYVVNQGSDNITIFSATDNANLGNIQLPAGAGPIWAVLSGDGANLFVVNQGNNTVSVIDSLTDTLFATINLPAGASPNYAFYENKFKRLFVSNTGSNTITVIKADGINANVTPQVLPVKLADVTVSGTPTSVTAVSDGTRAYAALGNCPAGINHLTIAASVIGGACTGNLVSVIDVNALVERKTIQVGPGAVSIDAAANGSRVYVISAHDVTNIQANLNLPQPDRSISTPSVSIIDTRTDSVLRSPVDPTVTSLVPTFHTPPQVTSCVTAIDSTFNNKVPIPCAGQIPFQVRVFP
jgi:YVTN family beta-propeller protein